MFLESLAGVIIALQGWILIEIINLKMWRSGTDTQINRIISDIESEKGTRSRINSDLEQRIRFLEHGR